MNMNPFTPIEAAIVIFLGLLFASLFIAWCCKQCSQSKQSLAPLLCPQDTLYSRQYTTAVDVQTGQPVIIQTVGRSSRNLVRITSVTSDRRHVVNPSSHTTTYGSIVPNNPQCVDIISRTPPPPYSEVCVQPQR